MQTLNITSKQFSTINNDTKKNTTPFYVLNEVEAYLHKGGLAADWLADSIVRTMLLTSLTISPDPGSELVYNLALTL